MAPRLLRLSRQQADEIVAHARADAPNECCGILTGRDGTVARVHRARNVHASPVKYDIDPQDLIRVYQEAERAGEEVVAFYHSHTFTEAYPSVTDVKLVPPSDLFDYLYVIVSLADARAPVIRAFHIAEGKVEEVAVEIAG